MYSSPSFESIPKTYFWVRNVFSYLIFIAAVARKLFLLAGLPDFPTAVGLLAIFLVLFVTLPAIKKRFQFYTNLYFIIQTGIMLSYGLLRPYEDTWGFLFLLIGVQITDCYLSRWAIIWGGAIFSLMTAIMLITHGLLQGLGYSMTYLAIGAIFTSFNIIYIQAEKAKAESQRLLNDLQVAHQRLQASTGQAETLAATQERNRLAHELHDSVSQIIFSISLTAQSARILADKDPGRVPAQLERLQELTGSALSQMRALISQWRPE